MFNNSFTIKPYEVTELTVRRFDELSTTQKSILQTLTLDELLTIDPYLLCFRRITNAPKLVSDLIDEFFLQFQRDLLREFLKELAISSAKHTHNGYQSTIKGIDLEFISHDVHYIVCIKSDPIWGNSTQHQRLVLDLREAITRIQQTRNVTRVQPVLGICYGKTRTEHIQDSYLKVTGQEFWYLLSDNANFYTEIVAPISYLARQHGDAFHIERSNIINRLVREFTVRFCDERGAIDWTGLVEFSSGNYDMDKFLA